MFITVHLQESEKYYAVCWSAWSKPEPFKKVESDGTVVTAVRLGKPAQVLCFAGETGLIRVLDVNTSMCSLSMVSLKVSLSLSLFLSLSLSLNVIKNLKCD